MIPRNARWRSAATFASPVASSASRSPLWYETRWTSRQPSEAVASAARGGARSDRDADIATCARETPGFMRVSPARTLAPECGASPLCASSWSSRRPRFLETPEVFRRVLSPRESEELQGPSSIRHHLLNWAEIMNPRRRVKFVVPENFSPEGKRPLRLAKFSGRVPFEKTERAPSPIIAPLNSLKNREGLDSRIDGVKYAVSETFQGVTGR